MSKRFHAFHELGQRPNIIVDGAGQEGTVLVLSHWPASATPQDWLRDTSAEIVLDCIAAGNVPDDVELVSNNHFDEDGLFGLAALLDPDFALAHRDRFIDAATAGDFGRYRSRDSARAVFAVEALAAQVPDVGTYEDRVSETYERLLPLVPRLIGNVGEFEESWRDEDRFLEETEIRLDNGEIGIEEDEARDLAIIRIPPEYEDHAASDGPRVPRPIHEMALHSRTARARMLFQWGERIWFRYRYETWVKFVSEQHPLRVGLEPLCAELNALETGGARWIYDGSSEITPALYVDGGGSSSLTLDNLRAHLCRAMDEGPVDWDPYAPAPQGG